MPARYTAFALIVDGSAHVDMQVMRALQGRMFDGVIETSSAAQALSRLRMVSPVDSRGTALRAPPGLMIVSSLLADMDPFEFCSLVRESYPDIFAFLAVSEVDLPMAVARLPGSSFDELILCPFSADELLARGELLMNRHVRARTPARGPSATLVKVGGRQAPGMPQPGESLGGYSLLELLKAGRGVAVYKAVDKVSDALVAVKALFGEALEDPAAVSAFELEGRAMTQIAHRNVLSCRDRGEAEGIRFLVSEWIDGPNLEDYLLVRGPAPLETFFKVAKDVAAGLRAIHLQGLIHRDVKLSNILLRRDASGALVSDMGIASEADGEASVQESYLAGSRPYMAPELFEGCAPDARSDIYSYGATMYHFLCGSPPRVKEDWLKEGELAPPQPARLLRPGIPEGLDRFLVERCLAREPEKRPASMDEIQMAIVAIEASLGSEKLKSGYTVLLVDDEHSVLDSLQRLLAREPYKLLCADSAEKALGVLAGERIHLLITDYRMPGMNGIELSRLVKERSPETVRIVFSGQADTESVIAAVNEGSVYKFLMKSWFRDDLRQNIRLALDHYALAERNRELDVLLAERNRELSEMNEELERKVEARGAELVDALDRLRKHCAGLADAFLNMIALYSEELSAHCRRTGLVAKALASACGATPELADEIESAATLHDVGKVALGIERGGRLSKDEEGRLMRLHPAAGAKVLSTVPGFERIAAMIRGHHERYDGQGYPDALVGEGICFGARLIAVADRFDRLTLLPGSKIPRSLQFVEESILRLSGLELDPVALKIFISSGLSSDLHARLYGRPQAKS